MQYGGTSVTQNRLCTSVCDTCKENRYRIVLRQLFILEAVFIGRPHAPKGLWTSVAVWASVSCRHLSLQPNQLVRVNQYPLLCGLQIFPSHLLPLQVLDSSAIFYLITKILNPQTPCGSSHSFLCYYIPLHVGDFSSESCFFCVFRFRPISSRCLVSWLFTSAIVDVLVYSLGIDLRHLYSIQLFCGRQILHFLASHVNELLCLSVFGCNWPSLSSRIGER